MFTRRSPRTTGCSGFDPCFVRRSDGTKQGLLEVWFPGAHYDIGRQRFVPFRTTGDWVESALHKLLDATNLLSLTLSLPSSALCSH